MAYNYNQPPGGYQQPPYGAPPPQGYGQQPHGHFHQPPPGQYGAPPSGQYGAPPPQGQYGAPPPQGQYGAPPPGQFGHPPPQQHFGAPPHGQFQQPPQGQYGAPPPQGQYGAPPPHGHHGALPPQAHYGAPQPHQGQFGAPQAHVQQFGHNIPTPPSLGYGPQQTANIDVSQDVLALSKATKGFGTNEKMLITVLSKKDPMQMSTIRVQFDQQFQKSLVSMVEKENSGWFAKGLVEITRGPLISDCYNLMEAMKGLGTKEVVLDDVLVGRSNADVRAIKEKYQQLFNKTLEKDLRGDLSGQTLEMYLKIIAANRNEDSAPILPHETDAGVLEIHKLLGGFAGKDSVHACEFLIKLSDPQLRALAIAYEHKYHKPLDNILKSGFSGHMQDVMRFLVHRAAHRAEAEAIRLEESMAGLGTKNDLLVQRVVRCHWDRQFMATVYAEYQKQYRKDLVKRIEGEIRGDYEKLMVACVRP